jgi:kynureninase
MVSDWQRLGVSGWQEAGVPWFHLAETLGDQLAPIVGAEPGEVVATAQTTLNLHQILQTFFRPTVRRNVVVLDALAFPSDLYAVRSHLAMRGLRSAASLRLVPSRDGETLDPGDIVAALRDDVALAVLPGVLYRSGQLLPIGALTAAAHEAGAQVAWDLSHAVGAVPLRLHADAADFAFFCTYKYLCGGPGAIGGLYVHRRHLPSEPGMAGWFGSDKSRQFDMAPELRAAAGAGALQVGTPPVLAAAPLLGSLEIYRETPLDAVRARSLRQTELLIALADDLLGDFGFQMVTPRERERRGGHVALAHREAVRLTRALKRRGVVPDFRPPGVVRLGPHPLYTTFGEIVRALEILRDIVQNGEHLAYPAEREEVG